jgi:hypothetical protein
MEWEANGNAELAIAPCMKISEPSGHRKMRRLEIPRFLAIMSILSLVATFDFDNPTTMAAFSRRGPNPAERRARRWR